jgi:hypothetical protein
MAVKITQEDINDVVWKAGDTLRGSIAPIVKNCTAKMLQEFSTILTLIIAIPKNS